MLHILWVIKMFGLKKKHCNLVKSDFMTIDLCPHSVNFSLDQNDLTLHALKLFVALLKRRNL
jgi:hypothetical protein